jgi:hypothetical protein
MQEDEHGKDPTVCAAGRGRDADAHLPEQRVFCADSLFGGCGLGVFSAAMPVKALHAVEGGICKDAAAILFDGDLKDANCRRLDILVRPFCSMDKQHYMTSGCNKAMPRLLFKDGVTSLTKLPSAHVIGILLAVVVVSLTDDGKALLWLAVFLEYSFLDCKLLVTSTD